VADTGIPDVDETDLTREEMEEVAAECGVDPDGLDDQQLLERLGVALGEIDESELDDPDDDDGRPSGAGLRAKVAARLEGAADRLRPAGAEPPDDPEADDEDGAGRAAADEADEGDEADEDPSEQTLPGEPIEGPTRDEIRDELRELGLPVTGTKDELQERLDQARGEQDDEDEDEAEADDTDAGEDTGTDDERLRDRFADRLHAAADWLRESGDDGGGSGTSSRVERATAAVRRRLPFLGGGGKA
jgi:hypothetical protein